MKKNIVKLSVAFVALVTLSSCMKHSHDMAKNGMNMEQCMMMNGKMRREMLMSGVMKRNIMMPECLSAPAHKHHHHKKTGKAMNMNNDMNMNNQQQNQNNQ